jgi:Dinucleotide-utilizing enzymes involved in molybdopterin and thiamine biosynthesis family 2
MAKILIPTPLRPYTDKQDAVDASGATVGELLADLTTKHAGLKAHLYNDQGKLRSFVNIYVNDEDIRYLQKEQTSVKSSDTVSIIPSVAGGAPTTADNAAAQSGSSTQVVSGFSRTLAERELPELTNEEIKRYSRHLIMPEVGVDAQRKLKAARVLCIGAGGLGSPAAMYLTAAGVGTLGIVDFDTVDFSNLQRQILHGTPDVGRSKLASAKDKLNAINPNVNIVLHETALTSQNALELFGPYDVILDGTDNFPTRYLVNDACVLLGKPNAYGSIFRFEGQASVFATKDGPCYRCLYPEPPPPGLVPSCAEGGVLGVLPGMIGIVQATEAIKLITGIGEPLIGRFMIYDALKMKFRELKLRKDPDCPVCGTHPTVTKLIDYDSSAALRRRRRSRLRESRNRDHGGRAQTAPGPRRQAEDRRRPRTQRISDQSDSGSELIPLGTCQNGIEELNKERRDRRALQDGRAERQSRRFPAFRGVYARAQPQGRHPRLGRQGRSEPAEILRVRCKLAS